MNVIEIVAVVAIAINVIAHQLMVEPIRVS